MGWLGDKLGFSDPARTGGQYEGIDRTNFDLPGYAGQQGRLNGYLAGVDGRYAPDINTHLGQQSGFRGQQQGLADLLMDRARGNNSVAELQLRQGADMANQQAMSQAASARPQNTAMAQRLAMNNNATNMMGLSGATALARAQEAAMAQGQLGQVLGQGRSADEAMSMFNASQQNQGDLSQAQLQQQQMSLNDQARQGLLGQSLQAAGMQQQGGMGYEQGRTQRYGAALGVPTNKEVLVGGITSLGGLLGGG